MPSATFLKAAEHGLSMPNAPFAWNIRGDIEPTPYANADTGFPNMHVVPDLTTLRPAPWAERTGFLPDGRVRGTGRRPAPFGPARDPRRSVEQLDELGYEAWVASELEFYLCTPDWQPIYDDHRCWSMTRGAEYEPVLGQIRATLLAAGIPVESSQTEGGPGQFEINVAPAAPIEAADNAAILQLRGEARGRAAWAARDVHADAVPGREGIGHHLHESLRAKGSETNVFVDGRRRSSAHTSPASLSTRSTLTAVNLPSINAYKRLKDYTFAPNRVSWALDNRTVAVRIPAGDPSARDSRSGRRRPTRTRT